jgi:aminopeptidase
VEHLMRDPRTEQLARILVETCLDVQPGWQVVVLSGPLARPLVEAVMVRLAQRGAYGLLRLTLAGGTTWYEPAWMKEASLDLLEVAAPIEAHTLRTVDAAIAIPALENTRESSAISAERLSTVQEAFRPAAEKLRNGETPWVGCFYPTPAIAQDAGMAVGEFEDFVYGACLLDWDAEGERMSRYAARFDAAEQVRIVAEEGTDLTLSLAGREGKVDAGGANMPGGEFFFCPVEDSTEGTIAFEWPGVYAGREIAGIRLRFEGGRVVDASATSNEQFLHELLDSDDGARVVGELGIGCNPGITRYMKNAAYDEKIDGTVHIALGTAFPFIGGKNVSRIHWDIVKDLRPGGRIELDGEVVQEDGRWLL